MKIEKFEDIEAWKESRQLTKRVYEILKGCKDYSFKDQIQRASLSAMTNIAEGFDRGTNKEFIIMKKFKGLDEVIGRFSYFLKGV